MAIIQDDKKRLSNAPQSGGTSFIGGSGGGGYTGGAAANAPAEQQSGGPGTGFVNIENYLRGPNGSAKMGGDLAAGLNSKGFGAVQDIASYSDAGDTETVAPVFDETTANSWMTGTDVDPTVVESINKGGAAPKVSFVGQVPDTTYKGPGTYNEKGLQDPWKKANESVTKTVTSANNMKTLGTSLADPEKRTGITAELKELYGSKNPNYTPTMSALDASIVQSGPGGQMVNDASNLWSGIRGHLSGAEGKITGQIKNAKTQEADVAKKWQLAQTQAAGSADTTNNYYQLLAQTRANSEANRQQAEKNDKETKARVDAKTKELVGSAETAMGQSARDMADRKAYLERLKSQSDGWAWSDSDRAEYLRTGVHPRNNTKQAKKIASEGGIF